MYNNFNAVKKTKKNKAQSKKQVLKIYNDVFACFRVGDKHLKIYTHTLTHAHTRIQGSRTIGVLELYLNTAGLNEEEFSHHRERHIEYTVYVQTNKKNFNTYTTLL